MATSTFKRLSTTSITLNAVLDPVVIRRETVLKHLQEQRQLLLDLDFKGGREDQGAGGSAESGALVQDDHRRDTTSLSALVSVLSISTKGPQ